ncbi:MAG: UDP-N-acetyl-D-glucosamine dehydrogenase [Planctomycetes bacterium DG_23]|nr:MAG: UDP-N-acetyl-D-glucosamine dehydrogenase [Planctomycetes bacterium DG_23]
MTLLDLIEKKKAKVGVIGLGYVGLPLVMAFGKAGFRVLGFDVDEEKVAMLNAGKSYIKHIPAGKIAALLEEKKFAATSDFSRLAEPDAILICVPTPLTSSRDPDTSFILRTAQQIAQSLRAGQLVILESTTYPGTTEEILLPTLEESGLKCGQDFYLAYSPEREDPGNPKYSMSKIPKVVGGVDEVSGKAAARLYEQVVVKVVPVSNTRVAEATKILENIYRAVNIALVNELKVLFDKMGLDIWEVIDAASTKPFGYQPFYPSPGLGGHCIPIDPFYLAYKAREFRTPTRFIELAGEINTSMPQYVMDRLTAALNERGRPLKGSKILVLGVAYKRDVDDMRESPAIELIEHLLEKGAVVSYNDPYIPKFPRLRAHKLDLASVALSEDFLAEQDAALVVTDHSAYDWEFIVKNSQLVIDTRNATKAVRGNRERIIHA